jgi:hypothetical protein
MPKGPANDEFDTDATDELPILLETAVFDPEERRPLVVGDDPTGEHTMHFQAFAPEDFPNVDDL